MGEVPEAGVAEDDGEGKHREGERGAEAKACREQQRQAARTEKVSPSERLL